MKVNNQMWSFFVPSQEAGPDLGRGDGTPLHTASERTWAGESSKFLSKTINHF
jgi:hypothetical protein